MIDVIADADQLWQAGLRDVEVISQQCFQACAGSVPNFDGEVALLLTDAAAMRELNQRFRGKDRPTNVLSFPNIQAGDGAKTMPSNDQDHFLGDIAIGFELCEREASDRNISIADHFSHLLIHGLLHLVGHDHQIESDALEMERLERQILAVMGIKDPYLANEDFDLDKDIGLDTDAAADPKCARVGSTNTAKDVEDTTS